MDSYGRGHISVPKNGWPKFQTLSSSFFFFLFKIYRWGWTNQMQLIAKNQKIELWECSSQPSEFIIIFPNLWGKRVSDLSHKMTQTTFGYSSKRKVEKTFGIPLMVWPYVAIVKIWWLQNFFCLTMRQLGPIFPIPLHHLHLHLFCHQEQKLKILINFTLNFKNFHF
jgi:hypothetical protein